jgi:hypothetical protein
MSRTATRVLPSALPAGDEEREAWQGLSRDEQVARFREVLLGADAQCVSDTSLSHVLAAARARVAGKGG